MKSVINYKKVFFISILLFHTILNAVSLPNFNDNKLYWLFHKFGSAFLEVAAILDSLKVSHNQDYNPK